MLSRLEWVLVLVISLLVVPTLLWNGGSLYGVCSTRFRHAQRLVLPTPEAVGHMAQALAATLLVLLPVRMGASEATVHVATALGVVGLLVYPTYNLVKRNLPGHGRGLGLNNTSYANNLFDFLLGVWAAVAIASCNGIPRARPDAPTLQLAIAAFVVVLAVSVALMRRKRVPGSCEAS